MKPPPPIPDSKALIMPTHRAEAIRIHGRAALVAHEGQAELEQTFSSVATPALPGPRR
jgi:hypothetical protein